MNVDQSDTLVMGDARRQLWLGSLQLTSYQHLLSTVESSTG